MAPSGVLMAVLTTLLCARRAEAGQCDSSASWCSAFTAAAAPASASSTQCAGKKDCISGLLDWQVERVLEQHNLYRAQHGACPATYSKTIEQWTVASDGFLTTCGGNMQHNSGGPYGENIAMVGKFGIDAATWDVAEGVKNWYCGEEGCYDYNNGKFASNTGHFTQVVWKGSMEIGCGVCAHDSGNYIAVYIMCNYAKPGNYGGQYDANVGAKGSSAVGCAAAPSGGGGTPPTPPTPASVDFTMPSEGKCPGSASGSGCASKLCWCDGFTAAAAPAEAASGSCAGKSSNCMSELLDWQVKRVIAQHNYYRAQHGACPATYSKTIEQWTLGSAGFAATCTGNMQHNSGGSYGENIAMVGKSGIDAANWDVAEGVKNWYCGEEGCYDYNNGKFASNTGHFTQVVWKGSMEIGCGVCHVPGSSYTKVYIMCNYAKAGNYGGQYDANVKSPNTQPTGCVASPPTTDECAASPCGDDQNCKDTDQTAANDYTCTCKADTSISVVGKPSVCTTDECSTTPCASGQTCQDTAQGAKSLNDFVCTCDSDRTITNTGGSATCVKDECGNDPCDRANTQQTCTDPNTSPTSLGDYTCACANGVTAKGGKATCDSDECTAKPCGSGQTCVDMNTAADKKKDFVCTCDSDSSITNTGASATCIKDECGKDPCDRANTQQTCTDPTPSATSLNDYICTCENGVTATGGKATCEVDECTSSPCGSGQTCVDGNKAANKQDDFVCTCDNDMVTKRIGGAVVACVVDECAGTPGPCGTQTCKDVQQGAAQLDDYVCSCAAPSTTTATGKVAICATGSNDECTTTPCGTGQTCVDPDQTDASRDDYVCTCTLGSGTATAKPASCVLNECDTSPCTGGQTCTDPDTSTTMLKDFTCACTAPLSGSAVGAAAVCSQDECKALPPPCGAGQTCSDKTMDTLHDFVCTCVNGVTSTGTPATCEVDECDAQHNLCGMDQVCSDPDKSSSSQHDFICTCNSDSSISQKDGPATCSLDDCESKPCSAGQTCTDPLQTRDSHNDFICACTNGVTTTGTAAVCTLNECDANPCGPKQVCNDANTSFASQHDFVCICQDNTAITMKDGPASCIQDECASDPCGSDQLCTEGNTAVDSLKDFSCSCLNKPSLTQVGDKVAACGADECAAQTPPCGAKQDCVDPDFFTTGDFQCLCRGGKERSIGKPHTICDECLIGLHPCRGPLGEEELCKDPNTAPDSLDDFVCECPDHATTNIGGPAQCTKLGECAQDPCKDPHALCHDPNLQISGDFTCECMLGSNGSTVGLPVQCSINECATSPCGEFQSCNDPNTQWDMSGDYVCNCTQTDDAHPLYGSSAGHPATCSATPSQSGAGVGVHNTTNTASQLGATTSGSSGSGDSDGIPLWIPLVIGGTLLAVCGLGAAFMLSRKPKKALNVDEFFHMDPSSVEPLQTKSDQNEVSL